MNSLIIDGILCNYGFCVKRKLVKDELYNIITKFYTIKPIEKDESKDNKEFSLYYQDEKYLVLPKFACNETIVLDKTLTINDRHYLNIKFNVKKVKYNYNETNIKFNGKLKEFQIPIVESIMKQLNDCIDNNKPAGGMIKLTCGGGKTVLAIYLACLLKLKTLIIVNKEALMDQWIERIKSFCDARIGIIRCDDVNTKDKDIVIGMLRSISKKNYDQSVFSDFGIVIYDEAHHMCSRCDSRALLYTSAKYTIGLSATPERADGLNRVNELYIGKMLCEMEKKFGYRVLIKSIHFNSDDIMYKEKKAWFKGRMTPSDVMMQSNIIKVKHRNNMIAQVIDHIKRHGRRILILSKRIEHLTILKTLVDTKTQQDNETHLYNSYFYTGPTKKCEKVQAEKNGHIIFATSNLAEEGIDIPHLDTIIFASPISIQKDLTNGQAIKKSVLQSVGRITRNDDINDGNIPLVIDICDQLSIYKNWTNKREKVYQDKDWFNQNYYWNNTELQNIGIFKYDKNNQMKTIFDDTLDEGFIERNIIINK